jgi:phospholipid transport system substrate-binding protein
MEKENIMKVAIPFLIVLALFMTTSAGAAPSPLDTVQSGTNRVLEILKKSHGNVQGSRGEIREIVNEYFNFDEMSKRSLGPLWKDQAASKQQEFVSVFSEFLFNWYIERVEKYTDEKLIYKEPQLKGEYAAVDVQIVRSKGSEIPIQYRLLRNNNNWKVYDVTIEGVSVVSNYRSQFQSILSRESFDELLERLRQKRMSGTRKN